MKKDIEWLKEEIGELPCVDTVFNSEGSSYIDSAVPVMVVYDLIDKLDEPEVLSQEWIDEHIDYADVGGDTSVYTCRRLKSLLVPKQELPVIPKFVADWITQHRDTFDLYPMLKRLEKNIKRRELTYKWYRENTHTFVNAYLTGEYEVEEEQKYYVINNEKYFLLAKDKAHGFVFSTGGNSRLGGPKNIPAIFELTEQEIKDYDERYWAFAKPVEEMEE